ncbi:putative acetylxylan esterase A [Fusarium oxysporum f. sp. rapae]|uniref:Carboxylic ester hydrolase n=1 Tax=Fusarium oxysporum f. sp. rapae TaxID=485398 RepID=A0A8J5NIJ6_FUSOX|nr:putative acetylxylan esterase A [Fusarium oxysporum f. sp. rapae]
MKLTAFISLWLLALLHTTLATEVVPRSTFTEVTNYGDNPTGTRMWLYVPETLASKPGVVVGIHWCTGSAQAYYQGTRWAHYAEIYGFIVIFPQTPYTQDNCWDVASKMTLTHNGGGASNSIANMVKFVIKEYNTDKSKTFVTGTSSGAMMTNVMAATYPDIFAAGIAYAGVPAGCFRSEDNIPDFWNSTCATGQSIWTQNQWANVVKNMYPGYDGPRPKMQIYHGSADQTFLGQGITHSIDVFPEEDLKWFGFADPVKPSSTTTVIRPTETGGLEVSPQWGQCGGIEWTGPRQCASSFKCVKINDCECSIKRWLNLYANIYTRVFSVPVVVPGVKL